MVVPLVGRSLAAAAGGLLVLTAWASVIGTLMVPRAITSWLTRWTDLAVNGAFRMVTGAIDDPRVRDRVLAAQAPAILLAQLIAWLGISFVGYMLLLWPFETGGLGDAFTGAGSAMFTLGFSEPHGGVPSAFVFAAAMTGLVVIAWHLVNKPTRVAAFVRWETDAALLSDEEVVP